MSDDDLLGGLGDELGKLAGFAQGGGSQDDLERAKRRLSQDVGPSTAASTSRWVDWDRMSATRSPFDATRIPISKLEQMRRDPMIAFGLMFIKVFLARGQWYIKSTDAQRAAFIDGALRKIYGRFVMQFGGSLDYGYQALVKNFARGQADWEYVDPMSADGKSIPVWNSNVQPLLWEPFTALSPRRVAPAFDTNGAFSGIWLRPYSSQIFPFTGGGKQVDISLDWAMWVTNEKDSVFGSLWGYPRTGYAYRYWWAYWYRFALADRAFEKWADPPVIAYHPTDLAADEHGNIRDFAAEGLALAEKLRSGSNVSLPSSVVESMADGRPTSQREWELKQLETTANFDALNQAFGYLDVAKLRAMMIPEQAFLEGRGGTSSRNVAHTLGDVFEESQEVLASEKNDVINDDMIPQLLEANFGPGGPSCTIETTGHYAEDIETARALVQAFAQNAPRQLSSIDFRKLLDRLGIPLLGFEAGLKQATEIAEDVAKAGPPRVQPKGGNAGVTSTGLYYEDEERERIELAEREEKHEGRWFNLIDRLFERERKSEPAVSTATPAESVALVDTARRIELDDAVNKAVEKVEHGLLSKFMDLFRDRPEQQEVILSVKTETVDDGPEAS